VVICPARLVSLEFHSTYAHRWWAVTAGLYSVEVKQAIRILLSRVQEVSIADAVVGDCHRQMWSLWS